MNKLKRTPIDSVIFSDMPSVLPILKKLVGTVLNPDRPCAVVVVSKKARPTDGAFENVPDPVARVLIVFAEFPVEMGLVDQWRGWAIERGAWEVHVAFKKFFEGTDEAQYQQILHLCKGWGDSIPAREPVAIQKKQFVEMSADSRDRNLATLLTMTLGSMGDLLSRVELLARRFKEVCPPAKSGKPDAIAISTYQKKIDNLLKTDRRSADQIPTLGFRESPDHLPKLLLRGDSGVGKSLIAGYLHSKLGWSDRLLRIPIPYLGKEDMFEYDLFGYCKGAYTGGRDEGSRGLLLGNVGKVVFLDEIGEANEYLQAKLLAFLDDYRIRPRGWEGEPFFCPVLVIAATNKDLDKMVKEDLFRGDLLARFTDRDVILGLNERIGDLPFILDCLLQRRAMNPKLAVEFIGKLAFDSLKNRDYRAGNFRELEGLFRLACERACRDGRDHLVKADVE